VACEGVEKDGASDAGVAFASEKSSMLVDVEVQVVDEGALGGGTILGKPKRSTFKRRTRDSKGEKGARAQGKERKWRPEGMNIDASVLAKKGRLEVSANGDDVANVKQNIAGLSEQPCVSQ
jgi:hypothetical protein